VAHRRGCDELSAIGRNTDLARAGAGLGATHLTEAQRRWLASFSRVTGLLDLSAGRVCGYVDLVRAGYVTDVGSAAKPKLVITAKGLIFLEQNPA
jgi:hypothetical protein